MYGTQGAASPFTLPGGRENAFSWFDTSGTFWLLGGYGYAESNPQGYLNDLWHYNAVTNEWAWAKGNNTINLPGTYGVMGTPSLANNPGTRANGVSWRDNAGNLLLFGGWGYGASGIAGVLNDVWKYSPGTILPVRLLSFTARLQNNNSAYLRWTSENEHSFDRYEVERSSNGIEFAKIGTLKSKGGSEKNAYIYVDPLTPNTKPPTIYYRLKMVDKDGTFIFSKTEKVILTTDHSLFTLYPNPASTSVQLQFNKPLTGKVKIEVSDATGKVVMRKWVKGSDVITLSTSKLAAGSYVVKVVSGGEEYVQKLIVQ